MAGNVVKSHLICFVFQKTFHSTDVVCALSRLFVRLGFRLLCACLAIHSFTVSFGFTKFKDVRAKIFQH